MKITVCARDCYDSCSMVFDFDAAGKPVRVTGDSNHPVTDGFLCKRGNAEIKRIFNNRIKHPYIRQGGQLKQATWEQALDLVAEKIRQTLQRRGPQALLYLTYDGNAGLIHNQFVHRLWHRLDATLTDMAICTTTGHTVLEKHFGASNGVTPSQLPEKKLIVFWGMNAAVTGPHIWAKAVQARRNGAKIITIDTLKTVTARHSDLWLRPRPGTDAALALFVIGEIIRRKAYDTEFLQKYTTGFDTLKEQALKWNLQKTAQFTGVPEDKLLSLVENYISIRPSATMIGVALQKRDFGWEHIRAIAFIQAVLGYHREFFYSNGRSYYIDYDYITGAKFHRTPNIIPQVATSDYVLDGRFDLIFVSSMNPARTLTNTKDFIRGIKQNNVFLVTTDTHWSLTARISDVVLPAPTFVEKPDVIVSWGHCYTRYSPALMKPLYESRTETEIMQQLASRLNLTDWWLYENPVQAVQKAMQGAFADEPGLDLSGKIQRLRTKPKDVYPLPDGKIHFALSREQAAELSIYETARQPVFPALERDQFILLSTAVANYTNSQFEEVFGEPEPEIYINPADFRRMGLSGGETVRVYNERDAVFLRAKSSDLVPQSVVWFARSITDLNGKPVNNLVSSQYQKLGRGPKYHSTLVKIAKAYTGTTNGSNS